MAEADERYLRAIQRQEEFGFAADSETVLMLAADVREARTEFLLTLEAVYRGEDVCPANYVSLVSKPSWTLHTPLGAKREYGYGWRHQPLEVRIADSHRLSVGTGAKDYRLVLGEGFLHVDGHAVEVTERRHRPDLAVREGVCKRLLFGQACLVDP